MDISVIIPTYNRGNIFYKTLDAAFTSVSHLKSEIIIINDSKSSSLDIPRHYKNTKLFNNPQKGCTSARNLGAKQASSNYLLFIDDDFIINRESIDKVLFYLKIYPDRAFNAAWEYPSSLYQVILKSQFGRYLTYHLKFTSLKDILAPHWQEKEMFLHPEGLGSGFLAISKKNFFYAKGYNENYIFAADRDMAKRLQSSGTSIFLIPGIKVYHNEEDKVTLKQFLERRRYGIQKAVEYNIIPKIKYSKSRLLILSIFSNFKLLIFFIISIIPNIKKIDYIFYKLADLLFVIYLFEGYSKSKK